MDGDESGAAFVGFKFGLQDAYNENVRNHCRLVSKKVVGQENRWHTSVLSKVEGETRLTLAHFNSFRVKGPKTKDKFHYHSVSYLCTHFESFR